MIKKTLALSLAAVLLSASLAMAAMSIAEAKSQGLVGERADGLVGAVQSSPESEALVQSTNAERLATYKAIAAKNGTSIEKVQAVAGAKLVGQAAAGEYVQTGGGWQKK